MKRIVLLLGVLSLLTSAWAKSEDNEKESDCITRYELIQKISNNEDVTKLNTGCITDMSTLFYNNPTFNQDIGAWDVSKVTNMDFMFYKARSFNQDLTHWNISNVTSYTYFSNASALYSFFNPFIPHTIFDGTLKADGMMIEYTVLPKNISVEKVRDSIIATIIETENWGIPGIYKEHGELHNHGPYEDLQQTLADKNKPIDRKVYIIGACNASKAQETTNNLPSVTAMMPCRMSVYEDKGKVKVSMMNTTLPVFKPISDAMMKMIEEGITKAVK